MFPLLLGWECVVRICPRPPFMRVLYFTEIPPPHPAWALTLSPHEGHRFLKCGSGLDFFASPSIPLNTSVDQNRNLLCTFVLPYSHLLSSAPTGALTWYTVLVPFVRDPALLVEGVTHTFRHRAPAA